MAIFGFNITVTIIGVFLLRKFIPLLSLPPKFLTGFYRFIAPNEQSIRTAAGIPEKKMQRNLKQRKIKSQDDKSDFIVPKNVELPLYLVPVEAHDFTFLHFYEEFCWLIDFTAASIFVVVLSRIPDDFKWGSEYVTDNFDLSILWLSLGVLFCSITLIRLSSRYVGTAQSGERSVLVMFGSINFVICLASLSMPSKHFEIGFENIITNLDRSSKLGIILIFAVFSALFGACFVFPGFRTAQMSRDATKNVSRLQKLLHHGAIYSPLIVPLTFYPKLFRNLLTDESLNDKMFDFMPGALTDRAVDHLQLGLAIFTALWRLSLWKSHLKAYVLVAKDRVEKLRKRETKITQQDIAKNISVVWYYTVVAGLQYLFPPVLILYLSLLWKSSSGLVWFSEDGDGWKNPAGLEKLPEATFQFLIKYITWCVSTSSAVSIIGGYAFHSICDTDI